MAANGSGPISVKQDGGDLLLTFNLPAVQFSKVQAGNRLFQRIVVKGAGVTSVVGHAELPLFTANIALPGKAAPKISIVESHHREFTLKTPIYPVQLPWPKNRPLSERPFIIDSGWYASSHPAQKQVSETPPFIIRGTAGTTVVIYPFNYDPAGGSLVVTDHLVLRLHFPDAFKGFREPAAPAFRALFHRIFANHEELENSKSGLMKAGSGTKDVLRKYLIITAPEFESGLADFVVHKQSFGYAVTVVTTDVTGTTTSSIKNYLQGMYDNADTRPEFVLLVGDTNKIPAWTSTQANNPRNDLYYSTLEGNDYFPDVFLGRFSVSTAAELQNVIAKTISTESNLSGLPQNVLFIASAENSDITEGTHNYVDSHYFSPAGYTEYKQYMASGANASSVTPILNNGVRFVVYSGHGGPTEWWQNQPSAHAFYTQGDVRALTNTIYPFVFTFACQTGEYEVPECFAETWIRDEKAGTTYWGSSVYSYWDEDDVLEKGVFKAAFDDGLDQICPMFNAGKMALYDHYAGGGSTKRYFEQYNLMGDPSVYTKGTLPNSSMGRILLDKSRVPCNGQVTVQVWDSDREEEFFDITVENPADGSSRSIELYKYNSGKYAGLYPFNIQALDPNVSGSGTLVFHYDDEHYGDTGKKDVTATLILDCDGPVLMHREINTVRATSADLVLFLDEKCYADVTVKSGGTTVFSTSENGVDSIDLNLTGLSPQTAYTADLQLTDDVGNTTTLTDVPLFTTAEGGSVANYPCDADSEASHSAVTGTDVWTMTTTSGAHSGGKCWFGKDVPSTTDSSLKVGPVSLPSGVNSVLSFWHYYNMESGYDGGVLEISTDDGVSWQDLGNDIQSGTYDTMMKGGPLEDQMAWSGSNDSMSQVFVDLSDFSGQTVYFRFRLCCDSSVSETGWYVDDIAVNSLSVSPQSLTFLNLSSDTVLTLNTGADAAEVVLTARDASGGTLGSKTVDLSAYSVLNGTVEQIFDPVDVSNVATVEAVPDAFVAGWQMNDFEDARGQMRNWTPAFRGKARPALVVPHVASDVVHGELYWNTWLSVMNGGSSAEDLRFTYTPMFLPFTSDEQVSAMGMVHVNVESDIFGGNFPADGVGFASLSLPDTASGTLEGVKAMESFDKKEIANSAQLTLDMQAGKELYVAHVDNSDYWWTGIALDNLASDSSASVSVSGYTKNGVLSAQKDYTVDPGGKLIFVTKTEFSADVAWFKVDSTLPLIGYELFGTTDNKLLAGLNIPTAGAKDIFLPLVDVGLANDWYGLTIVNPNETSVDITLYFYRNGSLAGQNQLSLNPLSKTVGLLGDYFSGDTDLIEVKSSGKIVAFCLEGDSGMNRLGGVLGTAK
ncbi:MAG: hypothetical protein GXO69_06655 [Acidobacteria bacterium]|nr:hypothetical protein [Acidobacteriota bacterium]